MFLVATCPGDWILWGEFCYLHVKKSKTWQDASSYCENIGGNLASIHDKEENDFVWGKFIFIFYILNDLFFYLERKFFD